MAQRPLVEPTDRTIGDVMSDVAGNVERLVRTEVRLTKATVIQAARGMARGSALVAGGVMLSALAVMFLLLSVAARLAETMKVWQATLVVAGGTALVAAVVVGVGVAALRHPVEEHVDT
jgi:hypothetical protein